MRHRVENTKRDSNDKALEALWSSINKSDQKGEVEKLLKEVLTKSEQLMLGRRILISKLLLQGMTQVEIREILRLSPNTTWKVKKWLESQLPEYGEVLRLVEKEAEVRGLKKRKSKHYGGSTFTFPALKERYPGHFLLFNLADEIFGRK